MERFARGVVIGVAVGGTTFVMFKVNNMVLNIMSAVNTEVIRALLSLVLSPPHALAENTTAATTEIGAAAAAAVALSEIAMNNN